MPTSPKSPIDPKLVRELAEILKETELTEIEVERDELRIRVEIGRASCRERVFPVV